ncbi:hypothetical protein [Streptomyces sp. NPDC056069]
MDALNLEMLPAEASPGEPGQDCAGVGSDWIGNHNEIVVGEEEH